MVVLNNLDRYQLALDAAKVRSRTMRLLGVILRTVFAVVLGSCSEAQPNYTEQQRLCISQRYNIYDPKSLSQCVDVCRTCMKGNVVTCNTSCKLKGAG
jgi:hypothetical protein